MKEDKRYKVTEPAIIISTENYKVLQIKKNLQEYLSPQKTGNVQNQKAVPNQADENTIKTDNEQTKQETPTSKSNRTRPPVGIPNMEDSDNPNSNSSPKQ
jgi:hypothetical protein